jgi:hypothetical protein
MKDRANTSGEVVDFLQKPLQFSSVAKKGFISEPFKAVFVDARNKGGAERIFKRVFSEKEAQIDRIQVNKFCALIIYHDPKIPTV